MSVTSMSTDYDSNNHDHATTGPHPVLPSPLCESGILRGPRVLCGSVRPTGDRTRANLSTPATQERDTLPVVDKRPSKDFCIDSRTHRRICCPLSIIKPRSNLQWRGRIARLAALLGGGQTARTS